MQRLFKKKKKKVVAEDTSKPDSETTSSVLKSNGESKAQFATTHNLSESVEDAYSESVSQVDIHEFNRLKKLEQEFLLRDGARTSHNISRSQSSVGRHGYASSTQNFLFDLREFERLKLLEMEWKRQTTMQNLVRSTSRLAVAPPPKSSKIDPRALKLLEKLGMSHTIALETFYIARPVLKTEQIYEHILTYVENGQEHGYGLKVHEIIRVVRDGDMEFQHQRDKKDEFRLLLWHGTKKEYVPAILEKGFKLPKPNGQMFGRGIYFADRVSKSANYCETSRTPGSRAYLLLCDVLLGKVYNAKNPHTEFTEAPNGTTRTFNSVKCTGRRIPNFEQSKEYNGSKIPLGETVDNTRFEEYTVHFNEFIVYSMENIKIMFLVEVEFLEDTSQAGSVDVSSITTTECFEGRKYR